MTDTITTAYAEANVDHDGYRVQVTVTVHSQRPLREYSAAAFTREAGTLAASIHDERDHHRAPADELDAPTSSLYAASTPTPIDQEG